MIQYQYVEWIKKKAPDIIGNQEMNYMTQKGYEALAARYGHSYAVISKENGYPPALSSKHAMTGVQKVTANFTHAYIYAKIKDIHIFVLHLSRQIVAKRIAEIKIILDHAASIPANEKIAIMGDFNSVSPDDSTHYKQENYEVIQSMKDAGFVDAYRLFHQNYTLSKPTKKWDKGSGYNSRIDFMWLSPELAKYAVRAEYIYDEDTEVMSDHYPLLVEFQFDK
jgi:exodeoxyribonuclease-3